MTSTGEIESHESPAIRAEKFHALYFASPNKQSTSTVNQGAVSQILARFASFPEEVKVQSTTQSSTQVQSTTNGEEETLMLRLTSPSTEQQTHLFREIKSTTQVQQSTTQSTSQPVYSPAEMKQAWMVCLSYFIFIFVVFLLLLILLCFCALFLFLFCCCFALLLFLLLLLLLCSVLFLFHVWILRLSLFVLLLLFAFSCTSIYFYVVLSFSLIFVLFRIWYVARAQIGVVL